MARKSSHMFVLLSALALFSMLLTGCEGGKPQIQADDPRANMTAEERKQEQIRFFEEVRSGNKQYLQSAGEKLPEEVGMALLSLTDYYNISYLKEFAEKYPELKIREFMFSVLGAVHLAKINMDLPLAQELERLTQEERGYLEKNIAGYQGLENEQSRKEAIAFEQTYLDALNDGNIRTYGFAVIGKLEDINAMADKEYGGKHLRVIVLAAGIDSWVPVMYYEPIYANNNMPPTEKYK